MSELYVVRANYGTYTNHFVKGGYVAMGFGMHDIDLSKANSRDDLYPLYKEAHESEKSNLVIGQQVGQISRFMFELKSGDYILTPTKETEWLRYGKVQQDPSYFYDSGADGCPFRHRRRVEWVNERLNRSDFSVPFQNTIRSTLTIFKVSQQDEFLETIGKGSLIKKKPPETYDAKKVILNQLLELDDKEFEILITHLLSALGFEGSEHTGKSGDGGVDAKGELNLANLAKVKLFVQAKRYKLGGTVSTKDVKSLRSAIPKDGQGAFITTADFAKTAHDIALDPDFPRIGLINGSQLADLMVENWNKLPEEFQERLSLKPGLVLR